MSPRYGYGGMTVGMGLASAGQALAEALMRRKKAKKDEELANKAINALWPVYKESNMGGKISDLSGIMAGISQQIPNVQTAMPFGKEAMPQSGLSWLPSNQQMETVIKKQNVQSAEARRLLESLPPEQAQKLMSSIVAQKLGPKEPEEWARASDTIIFNKRDGSARELPKKDVKLGKNDVLLRWNPKTQAMEEVARGPAEAPKKPKLVAAETSPGVYTLVEEEFAAQNGLPVRRDKGGITISTDENNRPVVQIGGVPSLTNLGVTKPTQTAIETDMRNAEKGLTRMENILGNFDESYLTAPTQLMNWGRDKWERLGLSLSETGKEELSKYTTFETYVLDNLNLYIKEITGAQMGETEAIRLMKAMPTMEQGPTKFKARAMSIKASLRASHDAYYQALKEGKSQAEAQALGDRASVIAFYEAEGGGYQAGPVEPPPTPSGYEWYKREDGVLELRRKG